jgi:hypothetical protein
MDIPFMVKLAKFVDQLENLADLAMLRESF